VAKGMETNLLQTWVFEFVGGEFSSELEAFLLGRLCWWRRLCLRFRGSSFIMAISLVEICASTIGNSASN
jgi:hypothetical protein